MRGRCIARRPARRWPRLRVRTRCGTRASGSSAPPSGSGAPGSRACRSPFARRQGLRPPPSRRRARDELGPLALARVARRDRDRAAARRVERDAAGDAASERGDGRDLVLGGGRPAAPAGERGLDPGRELLALAALARLVAAPELGVELAGEELEALADVLVAVAATLLHE